MNTEIAINDPATIQAYFEKVRQLAAAGESYPVSLDEVWPLIYSEKSKAVRALKKEFFEDEDYISFAQNGKRETGGTVVHTYQLTVACMEYFIARKVREVFNVYRQVFHRVADKIEQAASAPDPLLLIAQMLQQQTQLLINNQQEVAQLRAEVEYIKTTGQRPAPRKRLVDRGLAESTVETINPPGQVRQALVRRVNKYAELYNATTQEVWSFLYKRLFDVFGVDPRRLKLLPGETKLSALERYGYLDRLDSLIRAELDYQDE